MSNVLILIDKFADLIESSSSESDESDDGKNVLSANVSHHKSMLLVAALNEEHPRQIGYVNMIDDYSDLDFWGHFRVNRSTLNKIIQFLHSGEFRSNVTFHGGSFPLEVKEMVYICLQYLGNIKKNLLH